MDTRLFDEIHKHVPKINPLLADGLVVEQMKHVELYIDRVFKCAAISFPPGLRYLGYKRCTPQEQYNEVTRKRFKREVFDLAKSDIYLVKYLFEFQGPDDARPIQMNPRYLFLPFVGDAGTISIRGSKFVVNPVITDRLFSVDNDKLFMPITRDKLTFERITHNFVANGQRESVSVIWSQLHHGKVPRGKLARINGLRITVNSTLIHYMFCKFGLTETFKRFGGADVKVGDGALEITEELYPAKDWVICKPTGIMPNSIKGKGYIPSNLHIAIKRSEYTTTTASMVGALFYIVDHFPDRIQADFIDHTRLWKVLLGHVIFKVAANEGKLVEDIDAHLSSLDEYIDGMVQESLAYENIRCDDIYELFIYILETMTDRIVRTDVSSMYDKRLTVLRYILLDVVKAIFTLTFKLTSNVKREITLKDIESAMDRILTSSVIMKINTGHGEVSSVSSSGDNKFIKITSKMVAQSDATGPGKHKGGLTDETKFLHASLAEVGSFANQPKFSPTGHSKVNCYLNIDPSGMVVRNEEYAPLLDSIQNRIARI